MTEDRQASGDARDFQGPVPTSHNPDAEAESIGDRHADDPGAGSQEGAAAGAVVGAAVGGPIGLAVGAGVGAVAGAAGESADSPKDPEVATRAAAQAKRPTSFEPERPGQEEDRNE